jgi:hypothetical protein
MVDYYSILTRAVASLSPNTSEQRRDLYDRAHMTLVDKLRTADPTLSDPALNAERAALEAAIQRVERDALRSAAPRRPAHVTSPPAQGYRDRPPLRDTRKPLRIAAGALGAVLILLAGVAIYSFWPRSIADLRSISSPRTVTAAAEEPSGKSGYVNLRQLVYYRTSQPVGTIIVDKTQTFLYVVRPNTSALRYRIAPNASRWPGSSTSCERNRTIPPPASSTWTRTIESTGLRRQPLRTASGSTMRT